MKGVLSDNIHYLVDVVNCVLGIVGSKGKPALDKVRHCVHTPIQKRYFLEFRWLEFFFRPIIRQFGEKRIPNNYGRNLTAQAQTQKVNLFNIHVLWRWTATIKYYSRNSLNWVFLPSALTNCIKTFQFQEKSSYTPILIRDKQKM